MAIPTGIDDSKYNLDAYGFSLEDAKKVSGQNAVRTYCKECHAGRKPAHQKERELYINLDNGCYFCHNCGFQGRMDSNEYLEHKKKALTLVKTKTNYSRPAIPIPTGVTFQEKTKKYLNIDRGISDGVLKKMCVSEQFEYMPQTGKQENCIVFNYTEQGVLINQKFRDAHKNFKMNTGAELIPYNVDSCLGEKYVVITEGEFDALSFVECDIMSVISVPSGANANTNWLNRFWDVYFADKERVYIATDMDTPGQKIAEELVRRFGPEKCYRITFSEDCKDANDELVKHGRDSLIKCFEEAQAVPLPNVVTIDDFVDNLDTLYLNGFDKGAETGWKNLDKIVRWAPGQLAIGTGRTGDGKSEILDELVIRLSIHKGWNIGYFSPENDQDEHAAKIIEKLTGHKFSAQDGIGITRMVYETAKQWVRERISWINLPAVEMTIDNILLRAKSLIGKKGINVLVLDPYNYIIKENKDSRSENSWDTQVVARIHDFAHQNNVLVFLIAHPRKVEMMVDGHKRRITIEDISGTANFGNMTDYCFCVQRDDEHHTTHVYIDKVRRKQYGIRGKVAHFVYNNVCGRFWPCEVDENGEPINTDAKTDAGLWIHDRDLFNHVID